MNYWEELIYKKEEEYRNYIDSHRKNVQKAWDNIKSNENVIHYISNNINTTMPHFLKTLDEFISKHDMSKYSDAEFDAYREWFYPIDEEEKQSAKKAFDLAWEHHYSCNMHHWDWWYKSGIPNDMPFIFVMEMICDWVAMGYQFNNSAKDWYYKNKDNIHLGDKQKVWVEIILDLI